MSLVRLYSLELGTKQTGTSLEELGHLSPKASQEKRGSLPAGSKAEGQEQNRRGRKGCRQRPRGTRRPTVRWNVLPLGTASRVPASSEERVWAPKQGAFSSHRITHKIMATNSPIPH